MLKKKFAKTVLVKEKNKMTWSKTKRGTQKIKKKKKRKVSEKKS